MDSEIVWVRSENHCRFHAVYLVNGGYWTYCSRFIRTGAIKRATSRPPARCRCCVSRIKHPYLIPNKLVSLRTPLAIGTVESFELTAPAGTMPQEIE